MKHPTIVLVVENFDEHTGRLEVNIYTEREFDAPCFVFGPDCPTGRVLRTEGCRGLFDLPKEFRSRIAHLEKVIALTESTDDSTSLSQDEIAISFPEHMRMKYFPQFYKVCGMNLNDAVTQFDNAFNALVEQLHSEELPNSTQTGIGDRMLERETHDDKVRWYLAHVRGEGATDTDIRIWWNLCNIEKQLISFIDKFETNNALFVFINKEGMSPAKAHSLMRKRFPTFANPETHQLDEICEDASLPMEMRQRAKWYLERRAEYDTLRFWEEMNSYSSINALLRAEVRYGNV